MATKNDTDTDIKTRFTGAKGEFSAAVVGVINAVLAMEHIEDERLAEAVQVYLHAKLGYRCERGRVAQA